MQIDVLETQESHNAVPHFLEGRGAHGPPLLGLVEETSLLE